MFTSTATIHYDFKTDILRAMVGGDLADYYKFLYYKFSHKVNQMWTPRHGIHITIYRPEVHGFVKNNPARYHGDVITFNYNPEEIYEGGHRRGFIGFYLPVYSQDTDSIKKYLDIPEELCDSLHITLINNKHLRTH